MNKIFIHIKEVVRELLQTQERSYQAAIKLLITDVRSEMKDIKKEIEELKDSLEFTQREVNDNQDRVMDIIFNELCTVEAEPVKIAVVKNLSRFKMK